VKSTSENVIRLTGLCALVAGLIFAVIQPIHPPDFLPSVTTSQWALFMRLKTLMCLLMLVGLAGLYARQVNQVGWVGFAGVLLFSLSWALNLAFIFAEGFILPLLANDAPQFIEGFLTLANGETSPIELGALTALYGLTGIGYLLGGLAFGIATYRAGILPRWPALLLAVTALVTPAAVLIPHELQRLVGIPVGLAIAWLGFALLTEQRSEIRIPSSELRSAAAK
jgi:hypothetical protein